MRPIQSRSASLWLLAAAVYLAAEGVTALAFPGYSYATNYISDLGVPDVGLFQGRTMDSPLHVVMNVAFVAHGILFAAAAVLTARSDVWRAGVRRWFVGLALVHAVGIILVGLFPGSQTNASNGLIVFHVLGAAMAIIAGNAAVIVAGVTLLRRGPRWLGTTSIALGVVGLVNLVMLLVDSNSTAVDLLPDGVWERLAVYAILAWELLVGTVTLATRRGRSAVRA
ncbi:DUF998 domain-containing protein [Microbacterium sp. cf332]|uniref:DUF998 domain-containing protein n=1 Tax=Microbacterium sp. cf332 TaxID=1761804 RepID=UPI00210909F6|nr:DUF998 domain-containing protein [Microbacterium sp. cf332]